MGNGHAAAMKLKPRVEIVIIGRKLIVYCGVNE